jgi:predicted nucleic acid-binding protein
MPVKVIDASAVAAILFGEPDADELVSRVQGHVLLAPMLLPVEVASVCVKKCRRHPFLRDRLLAAFGLIGQLDITRAEVDLHAAIALAREMRLSLYDACYLWLAQRFRADLVTLDRALAHAATKQ